MNMNFMYNSTSPLQQAPQAQLSNQTQQSAQQFVQGISRSFSQDGPSGASSNVASGSFGRFPNMGPRTHPFRGGAPHVSSSTHPQNMGKFSPYSLGNRRKRFFRVFPENHEDVFAR